MPTKVLNSRKQTFLSSPAPLPSLEFHVRLFVWNGSFLCQNQLGMPSLRSSATHILSKHQRSKGLTKIVLSVFALGLADMVQIGLVAADFSRCETSDSMLTKCNTWASMLTIMRKAWQMHWQLYIGTGINAMDVEFVLESTPLVEMGQLMYLENNGQWSVCITEREVQPVLKAFHTDHGHFADAITVDFMIGRFYWPTRAKDAKYWCSTCDVCQMFARRPPRGPHLRSQQFEPMHMMGMDFLGPINPECQQTGARYVHRNAVRCPVPLQEIEKLARD